VHRSKDAEILILVVFLHHTYETDRSKFLELIGISSDKNLKYRKIELGELVSLSNRGVQLQSVFKIK